MLKVADYELAVVARGRGARRNVVALAIARPDGGNIDQWRSFHYQAQAQSPRERSILTRKTTIAIHTMGVRRFLDASDSKAN